MRNISKNLTGALIIAAASVLLVSCGSKAMKQTIFSRIDPSEIEKLSRKHSDFSVFYDDVQNITRAAIQYQTAYSSITYQELYDYETKFWNNSSFRAGVEAKSGAEFDAEYDSNIRPALELQKRQWGEFVKSHDPNQYLDIEAVQDYLNFNMSGAVIRKKDFVSLGGLKTSMKLVFWYEFLLRALYKQKKFYVVPKVGYIHTAIRQHLC